MFRTVIVSAILAGSVAASIAAQSTSTPVFLAPYRAFIRVEYGAQLSDPGQGFALEGFYRFANQKYDVGFRGGFAGASGSQTSFLAGIDFRTRIVEHSIDFPLDGALTIGVGGSFGDGVSQAYLPIGISLGRVIESLPTTRSSATSA